MIGVSVSLLTVAIIVALVIALPVLVILLPIAAVIALLRYLFRGSTQSYRSDPEETRIMQEIHRSLTRMEERVNALETIVLDRVDTPEVER